MNKKDKQIKYENILDIAGNKLRCYVLEDGTRVFYQEEIKAMLETKTKMMKIFCVICDKEIPKVAKLLERIEIEKSRVFEALIKEVEKGLRFICEACEDTKLEYIT